MRILQWLFKGGHQEEQAKETTTTIRNNKQTASSTVQKPDCKDLVLYKRSGIHPRSRRDEECEVECEEEPNSTFKVLVDRYNPRTCFYGSLNLKKLGSHGKSNDNNWLQQMIIREEGLAQELCMGNKGELAANASSKVLPNDQCGSTQKKDKPKGDKTKAICRMKELLRWASSAKAEKGGGKYIAKKVLNLRSRGALKAAEHDIDSNLSSSKNSFRWDVGSCSTSSSAFSGFSSSTSSSTRTDQTQIKPIISSAAEDVSVSVSVPAPAPAPAPAPDSNEKEATTSNQDPKLSTSRRGNLNWITTDEQFVVLEL